MSRIAKHTKSGMADRLSLVFKTYGYEGASLSMLAASAGLSKASLYHHYAGGKAEMAAHVLAYSGARLQKLVIAPLATKASGEERIVRSLEGTERYYDGDVPICLMNSLLLGEGRALFARRIEDAVAAWSSGLAHAARDMGVTDPDTWSNIAIERIQGALVLCRVKKSRLPLERCLQNLRAV
ncbi:TetR/AcrR family transcriptional regulator [Kordiimonas sp.]|uniref:TetR/AcrR family transcriptional regulator n=1 Tax=Kordiimonas sp. TaxID=1970157 RepID=UPI003A95AFC8